MNFTKWGGRRFLMCMGCGVSCTALVWFGKIGDGVFENIILGTVGFYIAGNTFQKWKASRDADAP